MEKSYFEITKKAVQHFKNNDPLIGRLIKSTGVLERKIIKDPFTALVQSIVFQQLAYAAADTIWNRFITAIENVVPLNVYDTPDTVLRGCGLSGTKVQYVKNIAKAFLDKTLTDEMFYKLSDEQIIDALVKIKGVGTWTAEMFLIFCLGRQDVFSYKDLGLRRGVQWLYGLDEEPSEAFCSALKEKWSPYSSVASLYLWEITIQAHFKTTPKDLLYSYLKDEPNNTKYYNSPVGLLEIVTSNKGLEKLEFADKKDAKSSKNTVLSSAVKTQLKEYFEGERKSFDLPLHFSGTAFQKTVWQALNTIPFGETRSYGDIAKVVGSLKAFRAVGYANNKNKIAIIVPCHRVIGSDGSLTGYAGGLDKKEWLFEHETKNL